MTLCGIYLIINSITKIVYVGQSSNLYKRLSVHKNKLKKNIHNNVYLQNSYNKYRIENFIFEPLLLCSIDKLTENEQIAKNYFEKTVGVYNKGKCVNSPMLGQTHNEISRSKMKFSHVGIHKGVKNGFSESVILNFLLKK